MPLVCRCARRRSPIGACRFRSTLPSIARGFRLLFQRQGRVPEQPGAQHCFAPGMGSGIAQGGKHHVEFVGIERARIFPVRSPFAAERSAGTIYGASA